MSAKVDVDDLCTNLQNALKYLSLGTEALRKFAPEHANKVAKQMNEIAEIFMDGVLESEISNGLESPPLSSVVDDEGKLNPSAAVSRQGIEQAATFGHIGPVTSVKYETTFPTGCVESVFPCRDRVAPKYPPGLGFGPNSEKVPNAFGQEIGGLDHWEQQSTRAPLAGHAHPQQAAALIEPAASHPAKVAVHQLPLLTVRQQPPALHHPVPSRALSSGELAATIEYPGLSEQKKVPIDNLSKEPEVSYVRTISNPGPGATKVSWAKMAAIPSGGPKTINLRPQASSIVAPLKAANRDVSTKVQGQYSVSTLAEPQSSQSRVIWLINCPADMTLQNVSDNIHEGPLLSICIIDDFDPVLCPGRAACVIFKEGEDALSFLQSNTKMVFTNSRGRYVTEVRVELGGPYPADDEIRSMNAPIFARRRLTFVRAHLFNTVNLTKTRFQHDLEKHCGQPDNIELIHLYNSGNATVIFASVQIAREVRSAFMAYSKQKGPYQGLQVSFSKDPCEHEMRLITIFKG